MQTYTASRYHIILETSALYKSFTYLLTSVKNERNNIMQFVAACA